MRVLFSCAIAMGLFISTAEVFANNRAPLLRPAREADFRPILPPTSPPEARLPIVRPLRDGEIRRNDFDRYHLIFTLQKSAKWKQADALIGRLYNPILLGHVYHQRYIHPQYRTRWRELKKWLGLYADHPGARHIYALAKRRKPRRAVLPKIPPPTIYHAAIRARSTLFKKNTARIIRKKVGDFVSRERPTQALRYATRKRVQSRITQAEYDSLRSVIARSYFIENVPQKSFDIAHAAATTSRDKVPLADWHAGLAAWRLQKHETALEHFEALSENTTASKRSRARGAFWAARVLRELGETVASQHYMSKAAASGHSFYALLAQQSLYGELAISWQRLNDPTDEIFEKILNLAPVQRALMLTASGERARAEWELVHFQGQLGTNESLALLKIARAHKFAGLELVLGRRLSAIASVDQEADAHPDAKFYEALFPLLDEEIAGPFTIDRALIFALIRRESEFKSRAYSRAHAHGLMQIIPSTAARITGDYRLKNVRRSEELFDVAFNIKLGQKYLHRLLKKEFDDNLVHVLAAYNAGPERLHKWRKRFASLNDDPLLYIESLPFRETRYYVKYVMENVWIYRHRLGQAAVSQLALVNYAWPLYVPQDDAALIVPVALKKAK